MTRVAIITPFLAQGGLEKVAVTTAEYLKEFYDIDLIVFDTFKIDYDFSGNIIDLNIKFYQVSFKDRLKGLYLAYKKLSRMEKNYDLLIFHGELAYISGMFLNKKRIVAIHENRFSAKKDFQAKLFHKIGKWVYKNKKIKRIITVSEGIKEKFIYFYNIPINKIQTIYNPFDIKQIQILAEEELNEFDNFFKNNNILIKVGRLTKQKGHKYLLEVFKEYKTINSNVKLVLLGDGELKKELIDYSKRLGLKTFDIQSDNLSDNYDVYFLGFQENPYKFIKNSKISIMSSLWEGFGNTIVESMACGIPVISTDCESGPREIISPNSKKISQIHFGEYGILLPEFKNEVEKDDINQWIEGFEYLLKDEHNYKQYSQKALQKAKDFDLEIVMNNWKNAIEESLRL